MKKNNKKLNRKLCVKCDGTLLLLAQSGEDSCYQCSTCHSRYCFEKQTWLIYNDKTCEWDKI